MLLLLRRVLAAELLTAHKRQAKVVDTAHREVRTRAGGLDWVGWRLAEGVGVSLFLEEEEEEEEGGGREGRWRRLPVAVSRVGEEGR